MNKEYKSNKLSNIFRVLCYVVLFVIVFVYAITFTARRDTIKRMNYSYNEMMETFPELQGVDMSVNGIFTSLDKGTLQLEMYQSFFESVLYSIPFTLDIPEERIVAYYDKLNMNLSDGWNKEAASVVEDSMNTYHEGGVLYGKEYVFNMQKYFAFDMSLPLCTYIILLVSALLVIGLLLTKIICLIILRIWYATGHKKKEVVLEKKNVNKITLLWVSILSLTVIMLVPVFMVVNNVHKREITSVIDVVESTIEKFPDNETNLFDRDKESYIETYRDSAWYVKRISYELADYLLYKFKTTGDDSLLTQYCADLNDLDKKFAYSITTYVGQSKSEIESFVPVFDSIENTVATETMYSSFLDVDSTKITNDWYNLERVLPTFIFLYFCLVLLMIFNTGAELYKDDIKK